MRTRSDFRLKAVISLFIGVLFSGYAYLNYSPANDPLELALEGVLSGIAVFLLIYAFRTFWRLRTESRSQPDRRIVAAESVSSDRRVSQQFRLSRGDRRSHTERRRGLVRRLTIERGSWDGKTNHYSNEYN